MKLDIKTLDRISQQAMLAAHEERLGTPDKASDFGRRTRHWTRLADAADSLAALLERSAAYSAEIPKARSQG